MKIEWLNDDYTEARITKGWFRKRQAHVRRITREEWAKQGSSKWFWRFVPSGNDTGLHEMMECCRAEALVSDDWQPLSTIPQAKVVRR
jgi:hypothetical protein